MGTVKILKASAGSGKTYRLAYEYIRGVVRDPALYRRTLAVTFTNKATEQMKRRILTGLDALARSDGRSPYLEELRAETGLSEEHVRQNARQARSLILHDYSHFAVSTIDTFFQRVARAFFRELGLDFDYTVELDRDWILTAAVDRLLEQTVADSSLREAVATLAEERSAQGKSWDVSPEIVRIGGELFKENYLPSRHNLTEQRTRYQAILNDLAGRLDAVQFAAHEALYLMGEAGLEVSDFANGRLGFAGYLEKVAIGDGLSAYGVRFAQAAESSRNWHSKSSSHAARIIALEPELMPLLCRVKEGVDNLLKDKTSQELVGEHFGRTLLLASLGEQVRAVSAEKNRMMIHETAALINRLVTGNDAPFIYEKLGNTYSRYMIDEFQDTSERQWANFLPLLDNALAETEEDAVMLIGDVKQSIYRWRGGNWRILGQKAGEHFARALTDPVAMDTNWRSERRIIEFNNALIRRVADADTQLLTTFLNEAPAELLPLAEILQQSYEGFEQKPSPVKLSLPEAGYVEISPLHRDQIAARTAQTISSLRDRGYTFKDIAILVRSNGQARRMADVLLEAGYPIVSQEALLLSASPVVEFAMAAFRLAQHPADGIARTQYNAFLGRSFGRGVPTAERAFLDGLLRESLVEAFEHLLAHYGLNQRTDAVSFLQALYQAIISTESVTDILSLLAWWELNGEKRTVYLPSEQDAVTIMTIHKAKGLEFKCVLIPYCDWELLPKSGKTTLWAEAAREAPLFETLGPVALNYKQAMKQSHYARDYYRESVYAHVDNLNLLYVALTRAERELYVMYDRSSDGKQRVSRLIDTVLPHISGLHAAEQPDGATVYTYGTAEPCPAPLSSEAPRERQLVLDAFPAHDAGQRLRVRWSSDRYFGEDAERVSPRRYGVIMHRLLELISMPEELPAALEQLVAAGEIATGDEASRVQQMMEAAFRNPLVAEWFTPRWRIRTEQEILTRAGMRRPDRVMTSADNDQAVVVDYKFGAVRRDAHRQQVAEYVNLLREMGYARVEGYLWYVELGEVEAV